jgi:hypothetical protein
MAARCASDAIGQTAGNWGFGQMKRIFELARTSLVRKIWFGNLEWVFRSKKVETEVAVPWRFCPAIRILASRFLASSAAINANLALRDYADLVC